MLFSDDIPTVTLTHSGRPKLSKFLKIIPFFNKSEQNCFAVSEELNLRVKKLVALEIYSMFIWFKKAPNFLFSVSLILIESILAKKVYYYL